MFLCRKQAKKRVIIIIEGYMYVTIYNRNLRLDLDNTF
jgi:hypothetical protein